MNKKKCLSCLFLLKIFLIGIFLYGCKNTARKDTHEKYNKEINNLVAFAKLYGYVRFFHPSNEAEEIDWDTFVIYGSREVYNCKNNDELSNSLRCLFYPIAPSINICNSSKNLSKKRYKNKRNAELIYWQHLGFKTSDTSSYNSVKVNSNYYSKKIFEFSPKGGEEIIEEITPGVYCQVPLTLVKGHKVNNNISVEKNRLNKKEVNSVYDTLDFLSQHRKLADVIILWNSVQHFYPYFDNINVDWEEVLCMSLKKALQDKGRKDFYITLRQMMTHLRDGHAVTRDLLANNGRLPIEVDYIENQIVTTFSEDTSKFKIGDILLEIDNERIKDLLLEEENLISGSKQWKQKIALENILVGQQQSEVLVKIIRNCDTLILYSIRDYKKRLNTESPKFVEIENDIIYVDLNKSTMKEIYNQFDKLLCAKGIIFDLRVYPNNNHEILSHLIGDKNISQDWMQIPMVIYPDHKKLKYQKTGWELKQKSPQIKSEIVFITSSRAISYAESILGFVEGYDLGDIIGQTTAGANGNVVSIILPGKFEVWFTGMKVLKHNGSQLHSIGIQPTVYAEKTIEGVKDGRDEFLEKAIEVLYGKINGD